MATETPMPPVKLEEAEQDIANSPSTGETGDTDYSENQMDCDHRPLQQEYPLSKHSRRNVQSKAQEDSVLAVLCAWIVEHQLGRTQINEYRITD